MPDLDLRFASLSELMLINKAKSSGVMSQDNNMRQVKEGEVNKSSRRMEGGFQELLSRLAGALFW